MEVPLEATVVPVMAFSIMAAKRGGRNSRSRLVKEAWSETRRLEGRPVRSRERPACRWSEAGLLLQGGVDGAGAKVRGRDRRRRGERTHQANELFALNIRGLVSGEW